MNRNRNKKKLNYKVEEEENKEELQFFKKEPRPRRSYVFSLLS